MFAGSSEKVGWPDPSCSHSRICRRRITRVRAEFETLEERARVGRVDVPWMATPNVRGARWIRVSDVFALGLEDATLYATLRRLGLFPWEQTPLDDPKPSAFGKLAYARECRHSPAAPDYSGHIPNGPACDAGDPTTPNGFLAPHDARTGSIRPGSRHRAPKRHCPVRARHGALSSPRFPLCDPGVAAVPWRRAARCSQLLRTRRRSVAIHSTWKAAVRTAVD